jgi:hypothetical protein
MLETVSVNQPCVDSSNIGAFRVCEQAGEANANSLDKFHVEVQKYTPKVACSTASALTAADTSYGLAPGATVAATMGSSNLNFTTQGGRAVVTYACDNTGEFCTAQQIKRFNWYLKPITISGIAFTNVMLSASGPLPLTANKTLAAGGPGFDLSGSANGYAFLTHVAPTTPITFSGSKFSSGFGLSGTIDFDMGSFSGLQHVHSAVSATGDTSIPAGIQINCGNNGAIGSFIADTDFSGGAGKTRSNTIDLSGAVNPAPMAVYQSQHYASPFTYTIPGFTAGSSHKIRLHFAETNPLNNAPNKRRFSVAINGTTQISNLDLFATVGMNKAYIKEFTLPANSSGQYILSFTASLDSATISGIEVF